eukprot:1561894-Ditylum_brightwellii.AAC.1
MADRSELAMAQLFAELEDLPSLLPRWREPLDCPDLNRDVGQCCSCTVQSTCQTSSYGTCCNRQSTANPLSSTLDSTSANDKIGDNLNLNLEDEAATEGTSCPSPPNESTYEDDNLLPK